MIMSTLSDAETIDVLLPAEAAKNDADRKQRARKAYLRRLSWILAFLLVMVVFVYTLQFELIPSESMEPNLRPGDHIVSLRTWIAYPGGAMPARGDVILFDMTHPQNSSESDPSKPPPRRPIGIFRTEGEIYIKRVIGLPGDTVQMSGRVVLINGKPLTEAYSTIPPSQETEVNYRFAADEPLKLGPDELFLLGDNRDNSDDSRFIGPVKRSKVIGKFLRTLYNQPLEKQ